MKSTAKKRLLSLEKTFNVNKTHKCALILCDPEILHSFDFSFIEAEHILILPDNGFRSIGDKPIEKGSYSVRYH